MPNVVAVAVAGRYNTNFQNKKLNRMNKFTVTSTNQ